MVNKSRFIKCTPHLPVRNLNETINYYLQQLEFSEQWTYGSRDGGVSRDELYLLFAEEPELVAKMNTLGHRLPLLWFVNNIDDVYREFLGKQVEIADPLTEHPYGMKEFAFIDINGYYIRIAEKMED
ncbi:MAG: VOC family protein [Flavisolibacter sp.]|jgi:hypothetical protein